MCQYSPVYNYEQLIIVGSQIMDIVGHEVALEGGSKIAISEIIYSLFAQDIHLMA